MADEGATVLANDHAVIRLFDHSALAVVLGALLALLPHGFELLLLLALVDGSGAGLRLSRPRVLRRLRRARHRRALRLLALIALRSAGRLARRLLRRLRLSGSARRRRTLRFLALVALRSAGRLTRRLLGRLRLS